MINIKNIIFSSILALLFTGCSYVTNETEEYFNDKSSFSGTATFDGNFVKLEWKEIDDKFQYQIFKTTEPNDEFSDYKYIDSTFLETYSEMIPPSVTGVFYYRIAAVIRSDNGVLEFDKVSGPIRVEID